MVGNNIVNQSKQNTTTFYMLNQCIIGGGGADISEKETILSVSPPSPTVSSDEKNS